jgi:hypothetical protein
MEPDNELQLADLLPVMTHTAYEIDSSDIATLNEFYSHKYKNFVSNVCAYTGSY